MSCFNWRELARVFAAGAVFACASGRDAAAQVETAEGGKLAPETSAAAGKPADLVAEFGALRDAFWVEWTASQAAGGVWWKESRAWVAEHGSEFTSEDLARARFVEIKGSAPADPTVSCVPRLQDLIARAGTAAPAIEARAMLLNILGNARRMAEWTDTYLQMIAATPDDVSIGRNALSSSYVTEQAGRWPEVRTALLDLLQQHPQSASAPGVRYALAEKEHELGHLAEARMMYQEVLDGHAGTREAEQASAAIYEIEHLQPGMVAPAFTGTSLAGEAISLEALKGKVVLLDFWATWCGPCLQEMPAVIAIRKDVSRDDLAIIGISLDTREDLEAFLAAGTLPTQSRLLEGTIPHASIDWPQLCDGKSWDSGLSKLYRVVMIPRTVLIDRQGRIAHLDLRGEELAKAIKELSDT